MIHILVMLWLWGSIVMVTGCTQVQRMVLCESGIYGEISKTFCLGWLQSLELQTFFFSWPAILV